MKYQPIFEDYSQSVEPVFHKSTKAYRWKDCKNNLLIQEDSLQRTLQVIQNASFAILTAYRANFTKQQNIERNRKLRAFLNQNEMGVHQLVGHWREKQNDGSFAGVVERSYLIEKPKYMSDKDFCDFVIGALTIDGETQDSALICFSSINDKSIYLVDIDRNLTKIGTKINFSKDAVKLAKAYSQHVKKTNTPFIFDGEEVPQTNFGKQLYEKEGFVYS